MSGEFGSYQRGYFDQQIEIAADDLANGRYPITREWANFFEAFKPIAHAIGRAEAGDSWCEYPIIETMTHLLKLKEALRDVEEFIEPFKLVADNAVREAIKNLEKEKQTG